MNILMVSNNGLYDDLTFSFVHNQAKTFVSQGHRVRVVIPFPIGKTHDGRRQFFGVSWKTADGVELCYCSFLSLSNFGRNGFNTTSASLAVAACIRKTLRHFCPDIIHAHTLGSASKIGALYKKRVKCPLVVTTHGSDTTRPIKEGKRELLRKYADMADVAVAVSPVLRDRLRSCGTKTDTRVIINGFVPHDVLQDVVRAPYRMIQAGNLVPSKRVDVTIRAFAQLKEKYPALSLVIVGRGPERKALENLCRELSVDDAVQFLGQLPNQEVFRQMCQSSFFVMASQPEGFGIVYLEAMAAGCVTIGTQGEGIDGFIRHGENGFLVPADDADAVVQAIDYCLTHPQEASQIAQAGQRDARKQTWEKNAKQYIELFQSISKGIRK